MAGCFAKASLCFECWLGAGWKCRRNDGRVLQKPTTRTGMHSTGLGHDASEADVDV